MPTIRHLSPRTIEAYRISPECFLTFLITDHEHIDRALDKVVLNTHLLPVLGDRPLARITPGPHQQLRRSHVLQARAIDRAHQSRRSQSNHERGSRSRSHRPLAIRAIRVTSGPPRERPTLTLDELARLAAADARYRALVLSAGVLGLRWSEAVGLRIGDVNLLRRTLTVRQAMAEVEGRFHVADTKTRSSRRNLSVPGFLIDELAKHLVAHRHGTGPDDLAFTAAEGGPLRRSFGGRIFKQAVKDAVSTLRSPSTGSDTWPPP